MIHYVFYGATPISRYILQKSDPALVQSWFDTLRDIVQLPEVPHERP